MSNKLIQAVITGVELASWEESRIGKYQVTKYVGVSLGNRNSPDGYWEHVWEQGGYESHNSFYGLYGEPFESAEEAAETIIRRRKILAVDANGKAVVGK